MKNVISVIVAFCCLGLTVDLVYADKPADTSTIKQQLPSRMDTTTAARLDAALQRVQVGQEKLNLIQMEIRPAQQFIREVTKKYSLKLFDEQGKPIDIVDFQTGEIARAAPAVIPPETSHDKAAVVPSADAQPSKTAKK